MIHIDLARARALVDEAIAERGEDYVYEPPPYTPGGLGLGGNWACYYVHTPDMNPDLEAPVPGCIVGLALVKAGVSVEHLTPDQPGTGDVADRLLMELKEREVVTTTDEAMTFLLEVQRLQDNGNPWRFARDHALPA